MSNEKLHQIANMNYINYKLEETIYECDDNEINEELARIFLDIKQAISNMKESYQMSPQEDSILNLAFQGMESDRSPV